MEKVTKGEVVIVPFPFSDLRATKLRPALTVVAPGGDDVILCQITSKQRNDRYTISLEKEEFIQGSLPVASNIRLTKLFTADISLVKYKAGKIHPMKMKHVENNLIAILQL